MIVRSPTAGDHLLGGWAHESNPIDEAAADVLHDIQKDHVDSITVGQVQDYMSWRRSGDEARGIAPVKEITLHQDLHALSPLFQYFSAILRQ